MGSKSSNSSGSNEREYGRWTTSKCDCEKGGDEVFNESIIDSMSWRSTYLVNDHVRRLSTAGRIFSLGISEIWCKGQSLTHDYIEAHVICSKCKSGKWLTFEYGCEGKTWSIGYYSRYYSENGTWKNCHQIFKDVLDKFNNLSGFEDKDYSFTDNNCKSFAEKFWDIL